MYRTQKLSRLEVPASFTSRQRNQPHRVGNMLAVILEAKLANTDQIFGIRKNATMLASSIFDNIHDDVSYPPEESNDPYPRHYPRVLSLSAPFLSGHTACIGATTPAAVSGCCLSCL